MSKNGFQSKAHEISLGQLQTVRNFNWIIMLSSITVPRFIIPKFFGKIKRNVDSSLTTRVILHNYACFRKLRLDPLIQKLNEEK